MIAQPLIGFGQVRHKRLRPREHSFAYGTFFLMLPLRSWTTDTAASSGLARNRWGPLSFHDRDHGLGGDNALAWLDSVLRDAGITDATGEAWLHTYPRVWGHTFKPVSFWYCHGADDALRAVVVEVNNTFGERHCYVLDNADGHALAYGQDLRASKVLHVSPFCDVAGSYRFRFMRTESSDGKPSRTVARIDHHDDSGLLIQTSVSGDLVAFDAREQIRALSRYPLMTVVVVARIHLHALRLWLKRVPFFRKPSAPEQFVTR